MLLTTAEVAAFPTADAPPLASNPRKHPIQAIRTAKTTLFINPHITSKSVRVLEAHGK